MMPRLSILPYIACLILSCHGFYKPKTYNTIATVTPKTLDELKLALCVKTWMIGCDSAPKRIVLEKIFDFTEGQTTKDEDACEICPSGQYMLKSASECGKKNIKKVKYSTTGQTGLEVGSNKIIVGVKGGGIKGKGLKLDRSADVQIRNLVITDINANLREGGSAIELVGVKNVLVDGNYFKNVGGPMVTSSGSSTGVTISTNHFDGATGDADSANCDGTHAGVWRFAGEAERVRLEHNAVHHATAVLTVAAQKNSKSVVHVHQNVLYDVKRSGVVLVEDRSSSVLVEGNVFTDLYAPVDAAGLGNVYLPQTEADEAACVPFIKRHCEMNTVVRSERASAANSVEVLRDMKVIHDADAGFWASWIYASSKK